MTKTNTTTARVRKRFAPEVQERAVRLVREQQNAINPGEMQLDDASETKD